MISIDAGKTCDKSQHPFLLKTFSKAKIEGNVANLIKGSYKKPTVSIRCNGDRQMFCAKIRNKTKMCILTTSIQFVLQALASAICK